LEKGCAFSDYCRKLPRKRLYAAALNFNAKTLNAK
jgi:hypothetical protein